MSLHILHKKLHVKSEIIFVAIQKLIQGGVGFSIALTIATYLNLESQGLYFTLVNFAAAYTILELGLSVLMVQISSYLFAQSKMSFNDLNRKDINNVFVDMLIWTRRYFLKLSALFLFVIPLGCLYFFMSNSNISTSIWAGPFVFLILSVSVSLPAYAILSVIEGIGKIQEAYILRTLINILGGCASVFLIIYRYPFYAPAMIPLALSLVTYIWAYKKYRNIIFLKERPIEFADKTWKSDLNYLQNRVRFTSIATFLFQSGPTLYLFYFLGPRPAGQMGLSISFMGMISVLSLTFFSAKIPEITRLVAINRINDSKKLFLYELKRAIKLTILSYFLWLFFIFLIHNSEISDRFLDFTEMSLLTFNFIIIQLVTLFNTSSRSFGYEVMAKSFFSASLLSFIFILFFNSSMSVSRLLLLMGFSYLIFCVPIFVKFLNNFKGDLVRNVKS